MKRFKQNPIYLMGFIFVLCFMFQMIEILWIKTEETIFLDNFINKVLGIMILLVTLRMLGLSLSQIGFKKDKLKYLIIGACVGLICFTIAYGLEWFYLNTQHLAPQFQVYVSGFTLSDTLVKQTSIIAFGFCILFNIINVLMEEGIFRGLFIKLSQIKYAINPSIWIAALFFGLWHLSLPIKSYLDGSMDFSMMIISSIIYVILAMIMGVKWGMWYQITGCLWYGIAEHFINNTITNLVHLHTVDGVNDLMVLRIVIAQFISVIISFILLKNKQNKVNKS